ncbi:T9SS type A sorting domain-containing protein [Kordia jejudonensis]|uniref:T9SS type A sorting domain-containing protein n=1 Tax=Kordia jejudonensis TaxID=1348245 RepID=UPI000629594C|nr:T9SS type A sorting domain-containing protein [Kordia jejudonensis]
MKLHIITLSILFLLFTGTSNAQAIYQHSSDIAPITLSVRDVQGGQRFTLETDSIQYFTPGNNYNFKLYLNHESEVRDIAYFRFYYSFDIPNFIGTPANLQIYMLGTTVPVIIPPVKKSIAGEPRSYGSQYPFTLTSLVPLFPENYEVTLTLCKYNTYQDYVANNSNCTESFSMTYQLRQLSTLSPLENQASRVTTYPNPTTDQVIIAYEAKNSDSTPKQQAPIQLTIFNKEGTTVGEHTIVKSHTKENSVFYKFDASRLAKGMYFFKIEDGKNTVVKTIVKQ